MLFRILQGTHTTKFVEDGRKKIKYHVRGDEIESDEDLVEKFGEKKFQRLYEEDKKEKSTSPKDKSTSTSKKTIRLKKKETVDAVQD